MDPSPPAQGEERTQCDIGYFWDLVVSGKELVQETEGRDKDALDCEVDVDCWIVSHDPFKLYRPAGGTCATPGSGASVGRSVCLGLLPFVLLHFSHSKLTQTAQIHVKNLYV